MLHVNMAMVDSIIDSDILIYISNTEAARCIEHIFEAGILQSLNRRNIKRIGDVKHNIGIEIVVSSAVISGMIGCRINISTHRTIIGEVGLSVW